MTRKLVSSTLALIGLLMCLGALALIPSLTLSATSRAGQPS